ncbi:DNA-directed RNA polymerase subunit H [Methanoplanus endosymbiosus]|uniref:DNA-directed RNA polymerase subunit Rpo5 n=1 Tax=Methanoplanus endosymbiosus TaxID=33865 RepID=A0A9E7TIR9_9EURY|nr:DNA-directed RNA polymerase subunit H [Methanoplanus endosymbiosus]UUX92848.1 DNA-directed RNA polymerase subunit H [Methanoplanus endosymbiosus]
MSTNYSVLKHVMVPDHQVMSEEEVNELMSFYRITRDQLPKIYHDDPSINDIRDENGKEVKVKINNVIRIIRESQTAGRAEAYRLVVKRPKK